jgi:hypothetical protein
MRQGHVPRCRSPVVKQREWKEVQRLINRVLLDSRWEPGQRDRWRRLLREVDKVAHAGKHDHDRAYRITKGISELMLEFAEARDEETRRPR